MSASDQNSRKLTRSYFFGQNSQDQTPRDQIPGDLLDSFSLSQLRSVNILLAQAQQKQLPRPKIVDLSFSIDLILARYYVTLFVGKDQRSAPRKTPVSGMTRMGNAIAATLLLLCLNLLVSGFVVLVLYLIKSALGIDLLPGHFGQPVTSFANP